MDTRKLDILLKTVKIGSLKKAADQLNYTQTGLIYLVNSIEEELGVPILNRSHKGISLSEIGIQLEPYINDVLDATKKMENALSVFLASQNSILNIGATPNTSKFILPATLADFYKRCPDIHVNVKVGANKLITWLELDQLDFLLADYSFKQNYEWIPLWIDSLCLVLKKDDPLADCEAVSPDDLRDRRIILSNYITANCVVDFLQKYQLDVFTEFSSPNATTLFELVNKGLGITFISSAFQSMCPDNIALVPLDPPLEREYGIIYKRTLSPNAKKFTDIIVKYCRDHHLYR